MIDDISKVRTALDTISKGVADARRDDVKWGDQWVATIAKVNVPEVVKACLSVIHGGASSRAEIEEAKLCLHLARDGASFAKRIREVWDDNCYRHPEGESIPNLWQKLYSYQRGQFPQLEIRGAA